MSEAQKIAGGSGSEQDIAEAKIELEVSPFPWLFKICFANGSKVLESLQASIK